MPELYQHRARKRFGQNFLHDAGVIHRILRAIHAREGQRLLEIGPGQGALTEGLLGSGARLDVIELDQDLIPLLKLKFGLESRFSLHQGDALKFDFASLVESGEKLRVVGNLPYNISTPLLFHLLESAASILDLHVMLQREVIERMAAAPGDPAYGRLTVMLAPWVDVAPLFEVGPGAFKPPPRVWSAVARLTVRAAPRFPVHPGFAALVAAAFSQRRKTVRNSLRGLVSVEQFERCAIDPGARPETLAPERFNALAQVSAAAD